VEPGEYKTIFQVEKRHWWYLGMERITTALLLNLYPGRRDLHILDAGCGTGGAMQYLERFGRVTGCDLSALALAFGRQRCLSHLVQSSVTQLPFAAGQFDLVTSFDVLYHRAVGDYRQALAEFYRVLKPGGRLFLRLPAYDWLRGRHDTIIHTAHRFTAQEVGQALVRERFVIEKLSYANFFLFPLALGKRFLEQLLPGNAASDIHPNPSWQDNILVRFLEAEARWLPRHNLPFGLTVLAVSQKKKQHFSNWEEH
jgi:ubiquinone/menaquinone biosynthesis C-methylase UbiE